MNQLPKIPLGHFPTPINALPRISERLEGPQIFVKRDDQTGLAFGGNKTRKLEYLVADAKAHGAHTLITAGAIQSNHCRQTAAAAARYGFECILVLTGKPPKTLSGNLLLDHLLGAEIKWSDVDQRDVILERTFQSAKEDGRKPYLIPYGGSNPLGASAYTYAFGELREQILSGKSPLSNDPDWIVFATSSGGTQAGLVTGARYHNFRGKVLGISVDEAAETLQKRVAGIANDVSKQLELDISISWEEIRVNDDYLGEGYAMAGDLEADAIRLFARLEGLLLDPVYTGRAVGGMIDLIRSGFFSKEETVLFWHTGGTPGLFVDKYQSLYL